MLTLRELATMLAALAFWKDEITQSGDFSVCPYLKLVGMPDVQPLTVDEIERLSVKLRSFSIEE